MARKLGGKTDVAAEPTVEKSPLGEPKQTQAKPVAASDPVLPQGDLVAALAKKYPVEAKPRESGKPVATYNPATHTVVNTKRLEQWVFCMVTQRTKPYMRMSMATRLAELLELPGGDSEAREIISGISERVIKGA